MSKRKAKAAPATKDTAPRRDHEPTDADIEGMTVADAMATGNRNLVDAVRARIAAGR